MEINNDDSNIPLPLISQGAVNSIAFHLPPETLNSDESFSDSESDLNANIPDDGNECDSPIRQPTLPYFPGLDEVLNYHLPPSTSKDTPTLKRVDSGKLNDDTIPLSASLGLLSPSPPPTPVPATQTYVGTPDSYNSFHPSYRDSALNQTTPAGRIGRIIPPVFPQLSSGDGSDSESVSDVPVATNHSKKYINSSSVSSRTSTTVIDSTYGSSISPSVGNLTKKDIDLSLPSVASVEDWKDSLFPSSLDLESRGTKSSHDADKLQVTSPGKRRRVAEILGISTTQITKDEPNENESPISKAKQDANSKNPERKKNLSIPTTSVSSYRETKRVDTVKDAFRLLVEAGEHAQDSLTPESDAYAQSQYQSQESASPSSPALSPPPKQSSRYNTRSKGNQTERRLKISKKDRPSGRASSRLKGKRGNDDEIDRKANDNIRKKKRKTQDNGQNSQNIQPSEIKFSFNEKDENRRYPCPSKTIIRNYIEMDDKSLFKNIGFMLTGLSGDVFVTKKHIKSSIYFHHIIEQHGGKVLSAPIGRAKKTPHDIVRMDLPFSCCILLAPSPIRTQKYFLALAAGVPIVHYNWVVHSIELGVYLDPCPYLLPRGKSLENSEWIEQDQNVFRCYPPPLEELLFFRPASSQSSQIKVGDKEKSSLFVAQRIELLGSYTFKETWKSVIERAGGRVVDRLIFEGAGDIDYLISETPPIPSIQDIVNRKNLHIYTLEWLLQCLICREVIPPGSMEEYTFQR